MEKGLRGARADDLEPNLLDVASVGSLVGVGCGALEEDLTVGVQAALRRYVHQQGGCDKVEFVLANLDRRVIQTVVRADAERDVAFTLRMGCTVPFVHPILERMCFHGDFAVGTRDIGGIEPVG